MRVVASYSLRHTPVGPAVATISGTGTTVAEIAGVTAGVVVAVVGVATFIIGIAKGNRERRKEYEREINEAKAEARKETLDAIAPELAELREIRTRYWRILEGRRREGDDET